MQKQKRRKSGDLPCFIINCQFQGWWKGNKRLYTTLIFRSLLVGGKFFKEAYMKRKLTTFITILLVLCISLFAITGCDGEKSDVKAQILSSTQTTVVIKITQTDGKATLLDAMEYLKEQNQLTYQKDAQNMIKAINGSQAGANSFWALYTSDSEMANAEWGTFDYQGQILGSAIFGANDLEVIQNGVYVWDLTTF